MNSDFHFTQLMHQAVEDLAEMLGPQLHSLRVKFHECPLIIGNSHAATVPYTSEIGEAANVDSRIGEFPTYSWQGPERESPAIVSKLAHGTASLWLGHVNSRTLRVSDDYTDTHGSCASILVL